MEQKMEDGKWQGQEDGSISKNIGMDDFGDEEHHSIYMNVCREGFKWVHDIMVSEWLWSEDIVLQYSNDYP